MRKNGRLSVRGKSVEPFLVVKSIFGDDDKGRAMIRLNGYRTSCIRKRNPMGLKRANIIKELMKTL